MKQSIYNGLGLPGVGLTVISLRGDLLTASWGWLLMVFAGFLIMGMGIAEIFFGRDS